VHDVVIVGAGSAGCVLAARLTEDPRTSVLLLEAGPRDRSLQIRVPAAFSKLFRSPLDWGYDTVPQDALDGRRVVFPRGKVLGGCSSINAMMAIRGHRADHDAWPAGWGWEEVAGAYARSDASFPRAHQRHPSPLTLDFLDAAAAAGIPRAADLNGADNTGAGLTPVSVRRGRRFSVVDGYLRPALRRPNLTVVTGAHATRLLVEGGRARGVAYLLGGGGQEEEAVAAREVVLAAGAIDTPKLLLLSGIGPPEELERHGIAVVHEAPGVGRNLRDHLANGVLAAVDAETLYTAERPRHLLSWLGAGRGPLTSNVAEAAAFVRVDPAAAAPDLELIFAPVLFEEEGTAPPSQDGVTVAAVLLQPRSRGEVRLASSDPLAPPAIDPRYLTDPDGLDARTLREGVRLARRVLAAAPLARHVTGELLPGEAAADDDAIDAHLRARSQTLYHPVGTCPMGEDDAAVVTPDLRLRGLDGLRVVDASVIPSLPRGHTNWPTVMVAERAAELIRAA
jgi:choline dehydrogenase